MRCVLTLLASVLLILFFSFLSSYPGGVDYAYTIGVSESVTIQAFGTGFLFSLPPPFQCLLFIITFALFAPLFFLNFF